MNEVIVRQVKLPLFIKGQVLLDEDGDYNIYINSEYPADVQADAYAHEMKHVDCGDLDGTTSITEIEDLPQ